jgi:hypothetical protein
MTSNGDSVERVAGQSASRTGAVVSCVASVVAAVSAGTWIVGLVLQRRRDWACSYRYWEPGDTGRNGLADGLALAMFVTLALSLVACVLALVARRRWSRPPGTTVVISLIPLLILLSFIAFDEPGLLADVELIYDCSTG